jgi:Bacteriophage baseplate protein W
MRPEYGCELHRLAFSPNDDTTAGLAIYYVRRALERWEPRIQLLHVDAGRSPESPERLDISVEYRVRATQRGDRLVYPFTLAGGPG